MLYSFELTTAKLTRDCYVVVTEGDRSFKLVARKGESRHVYTNIPTDGVPTITIDVQNQLKELAFGTESYATPEQLALDTDLLRLDGVRYKRATTGDAPRHAIITFPHFKGHGGFAAPYAIFDGGKFAFDDTLYLSFQDSFLTAGTYFLSDNFGQDVMPAAVEAIRAELASYGIDPSATTFVGSSKGSNTAAMASSHFEGNQLIVCSYATELEHFVKNTDYAHLADSLNHFGKVFPDSLELLFGQAAKKDVHWFYSLHDEVSNRGYETEDMPHLNKYACQEGHSQVLPGNWDSIRGLIAERHGLN